MEPGHCFFVDDLAENVEAAQAVGMGGHHFQGDYEALESDLRAAGYDWTASSGERPPH